MTTPAEILRKARELIETKGWTQGAYARSAKGEPVDWYNKRACQFCLNGALNYAEGLAFVSYDGRELIREAVGQPNTIKWNDEPTRTKAEVLAVFDRAIALAEAGR